MNRLVYILYALVLTAATTGINSSPGTGGSGSSFRSWGNSSGYSTGGSSSWSGGSHK